jgi:N-methylhydantoinase A
VFSAAGLLAADPIRTEARTVQWSPENGDLESINGPLEAMHKAALANLEGRGFAPDEVAIEYSLAMRFAGQTFDVDVDFEPRPLTEEDRRPLIERFQARYAELYGAGSVWENFPMLVMTARVVARGVRPKPPPARIDGNGTHAGGDAEAARRTSRAVFLAERGEWTDIDCYLADRLPVGVTLQGPCIIEDVDTTIFVPAYASVAREPFGGFELDLQATDGEG